MASVVQAGQQVSSSVGPGEGCIPGMASGFSPPTGVTETRR